MTAIRTSPRPRRSTVHSFLSFGGLSGLGWLLDFSLLLLLVGWGGLPGFRANIISSLVASAMVFLVSRRFVFASAAGRVPLRLAAYLLFTLLVILIASAALQLVAGFIGEQAARHALAVSPAVLAALAKIVITPPQLVLNFLMSRYLNERAMTGGDRT